jgi:hypothetical protein
LWKGGCRIESVTVYAERRNTAIPINGKIKYDLTCTPLLYCVVAMIIMMQE